MLSAWNGARLRDLRDRAELTQAELAERVGSPQNTISQWENGKMEPRAEDVFKLADALDVDCNAFRQPVGAKPFRRRHR